MGEVQSLEGNTLTFWDMQKIAWKSCTFTNRSFFTANQVDPFSLFLLYFLFAYSSYRDAPLNVERDTITNYWLIDWLIAQQTSARATPDVCGRPAPVGVAPSELKLDLGSSSPPPGIDRSPASDDDDHDDRGPDVDRQQAVNGPLRAHVSSMAKRFVEDGREIRRSVLEHLHRWLSFHNFRFALSPLKSSTCFSTRHLVREIILLYQSISFLLGR